MGSGGAASKTRLKSEKIVVENEPSSVTISTNCTQPRLRNNENHSEITQANGFRSLSTDVYINDASLHEITSDNEFFMKLRENCITHLEVLAYAKKNPNCLFMSDENELTAVEYARINSNKDLQLFLSELKFSISKKNVLMRI